MANLPKSITDLLPTDPVSLSVLDHTYQNLSTPTFNHALRVFLLARRLHDLESAANTHFTHPSASTSKPVIKPEVLFAASMFHDAGTCACYNGPQRFEVEGGDAAVAYMRSLGMTDEADLHSIWCGISLHTSVGIAERIDPFTRLVRHAVKSDFSPAVRESFGLTEYGLEIEAGLPRLEIERVLAEEVVGQATRGEREQGLWREDGVWTDSVKFPKASWPGILLRGQLEEVGKHGKDWKGENPAF